MFTNQFDILKIIFNGGKTSQIIGEWDGLAHLFSMYIIQKSV